MCRGDAGGLIVSISTKAEYCLLSSNVWARSLANSRSISMQVSENKASMLPWSIQSTEGLLQSTTLPTIIRTFEEFARVDIYTGDIDPVYFAIGRAREAFGDGWATRFAVAM